MDPIGDNANSADPFQMLQNVMSDQDLQLACRSFHAKCKNENIRQKPHIKKWTHPNNMDGQVH